MPPYVLPFPRLVIEVFSDNATTHGPSTLKAVIHDAVKVGWSQYSRFPSSAFFSLRQSSTHNADIVPGLDHVRVWYINDATGYGPVLVFAGRIGDPDESGDDVVWTAWSYLAELALSRSGYKVEYKSKQIAAVVTQEWSRDDALAAIAGNPYRGYGAKVRRPTPSEGIKSTLNFVATGTIQNPKASDGTSEMLTDPIFGVIDVPRLLLMFDLTEIGRANTTQNTTFEITHATSPTFNFWRDRGSLVTGQRLTFPGVVKDFRYVPGVLDIRNDLATIGTKNGVAVEVKARQQTGTYGYDSFGLRQDTFTIKTLSGYPKLTEEASKSSAQVSITQRAVKEASTLTRLLQLDVRHQFFEPFDGWSIEDTIKVQASRGRTAIDANYRIVGVRGILDDRGYDQALFLTLPVT